MYYLISSAGGYHIGPRRSKLSPECISSCQVTNKALVESLDWLFGQLPHSPIRLLCHSSSPTSPEPIILTGSWRILVKILQCPLLTSGESPVSSIWPARSSLTWSLSTSLASSAGPPVLQTHWTVLCSLRASCTNNSLQVHLYYILPNPTLYSGLRLNAIYYKKPSTSPLPGNTNVPIHISNEMLSHCSIFRCELIWLITSLRTQNKGHKL